MPLPCSSDPANLTTPVRFACAKANEQGRKHKNSANSSLIRIHLITKTSERMFSRYVDYDTKLILSMIISLSIIKASISSKGRKVNILGHFIHNKRLTS